MVAYSILKSPQAAQRVGSQAGVGIPISSPVYSNIRKIFPILWKDAPGEKADSTFRAEQSTMWAFGCVPDFYVWESVVNNCSDKLYSRARLHQVTCTTSFVPFADSKVSQRALADPAGGYESGC